MVRINDRRQSTREFLSLNGYYRSGAKNGTDALGIARKYKSPIHLMIVDVVMPHMGGANWRVELSCLRLRRNHGSGHRAIEVTTSFLQKPFSLRTLAPKIREVLDADVAALAAPPSV